jgi:hypothetical protein
MAPKGRIKPILAKADNSKPFSHIISKLFEPQPLRGIARIEDR